MNSFIWLLWQATKNSPQHVFFHPKSQCQGFDDLFSAAILYESNLKLDKSNKSIADVSAVRGCAAYKSLTEIEWGAVVLGRLETWLRGHANDLRETEMTETSQLAAFVVLQIIQSGMVYQTKQCRNCSFTKHAACVCIALTEGENNPTNQ